MASSRKPSAARAAGHRAKLEPKPKPKQKRTRQSVASARPPAFSRRGEALVLGSALTISEVVVCGRALRGMLERGTVTADARALESIDTAGLQLLLAAATAAQEHGLRLKLVGATELLTNAAEALGVARQLIAAVELSA